jgi:hypothetical protein
MTDLKMTTTTDMSFHGEIEKNQAYLFDPPFPKEETPKKFRPSKSLFITKSEFKKMMVIYLYF